MVYDGTTLKFYRNGFLLGQVPATGNLVQNILPTRIGRYSGTFLSTFLGYINEVRIWNVARTQTEIQTYMQVSLPNPTTQTGLLAYYSFDNLVNKQGNVAWNGTLSGSAAINATNSSCTLLIDSCLTSSCTNWLKNSAYPSYVTIGDLDVPGNTITVEAEVNRNTAYLPGGGNNSEGDVVSKHTDPPNVNYLLRPNHAYITTTNGFFGTPDICDLELNKTYHVAMVYNGATLKFYRNGFLMSQINATGSLIQNNLNTQIGLYTGGIYSTQFLGYINEVRIWNTARTQAQLQSYMNTSLPAPSTQTGLLAYYTFDNLDNKQGNSFWNGVLSGAASLNATNPNCNFLADSCNTIVPVTLTSFDATAIDNKLIKLTWETESERNIKNYSVMRSTSGYEQDFINIGSVVSNRNSLSNKYNLTDNSAKPNTLYYYKLLINDLDGSKKSGPIKTAKIINREFYTLIYPNPTNGLVKVFINNAGKGAQLTVTNQLGQVITTKRTNSNSDFITIDISTAPHGIYWISIQTGDNKFVEKIIK